MNGIPPAPPVRERLDWCWNMCYRFKNRVDARRPAATPVVLTPVFDNDTGIAVWDCCRMFVIDDRKFRA